MVNFKGEGHPHAAAVQLRFSPADHGRQKQAVPAEVNIQGRILEPRQAGDAECILRHPRHTVASVLLARRDIFLAPAVERFKVRLPSGPDAGKGLVLFVKDQVGGEDLIPLHQLFLLRQIGQLEFAVPVDHLADHI